MSMRNYPFSDYGLVFSKEDIERIKKIIAKKEECDPEEVELGECFQEVGNFTGEALKIMPDGSLNESDSYMSFCDESVYYIGLKNAISLFSTAYKSIDDAAKELREEANEYFPTDYNFADNIRYILGVCWG